MNKSIHKHVLTLYQVQMCSPIVTLFVPGQSVTVGKCHYSHAYLLKERPFGTSLFCHYIQNVTKGVVTIREHICTLISYLTINSSLFAVIGKVNPSQHLVWS